MGNHSSLRPDGYFEIHDPDAKRIVSGETLQCVHCGAHWVIQPGSGKIRGFCLRCNGPICGPGCAACVPIERQLELMEDAAAGKPDTKPVSVPVIWTPGG